MGDFPAYPALSITPMASPLDMAGKAAALNGQLLQNTGMGLEQHYTRLSAMFRAGMASLNADGTADPQAVKNGITDMVKNGIISPTEGATALTSVPNDPKAAGAWLRSNLAGVGNNLAAITPHMQSFDTGAGAVYRQDNPYAAGGNQTPTQINEGQSVTDATAIVSWQDPKTGQIVMGTKAQQLAALGVNAAPQVTEAGAQPAAQPPQQPVQGVPAPDPIAATPLPPTGQDVAAQTMAALGKPNMLTGKKPVVAANPLTGAQPTQVNTPAPGTGGTPMVQDPQRPVYQADNATNFQADVNAGTGPQMQTRIDNLHELAGTIDDAYTGGAQDTKVWAEKLAAAVGVPIDYGATGSDIMHKLSQQAASYLPGSGASDAARAAAMGMTPNGDMTEDAIRSTTAMVLGKAQFDAQFAKDALAWQQAGGDPTNNYAAFKSQYADTHPGPMLYAMLAMRETGDVKGFNRMLDYIKSLPASERAKVSAQIGILKGQMNGQQ